MNFQQEIKKQLVALAMIAGKDLNEIALAAFVEALSDLDQSAVLFALKDWIKTSKGFPYPSDIREKLMPEISDEDDAQDVANLVIAAVSSCGYTNPERAREKIGDLGWETVTRMGGWKNICETLNHENEGIYRAQIRDYAETVIRKSKRGQLDVAPSLPTPDSYMQKLIAKNVKGIE